MAGLIIQIGEKLASKTPRVDIAQRGLFCFNLNGRIGVIARRQRQQG
jgi:hypothetical protein